MRLRTKLVASHLGIAALVWVVVVTALRVQTNVQDVQGRIREVVVPTIIALENLKAGGIRVVASTAEFIAVASEREHADETKRDAEGISAAGQQELELSEAETGTLECNEALERYAERLAQRQRHRDGEQEILEQLRLRTATLIQSGTDLIALKMGGARGNAMIEGKEGFGEAESVFLATVNLALEDALLDLTE
mgnify:CR=1 FL=1